MMKNKILVFSFFVHKIFAVFKEKKVLNLT